MSTSFSGSSSKSSVIVLVSSEVTVAAAKSSRRHCPNSPSRWLDSRFWSWSTRLRKRRIFASRRRFSVPTLMTCWRISLCRCSRFSRHLRAALRFLCRLLSSTTAAVAAPVADTCRSTSTDEQPTVAAVTDMTVLYSYSIRKRQSVCKKLTSTVHKRTQSTLPQKHIVFICLVAVTLPCITWALSLSWLKMPIHANFPSAADFERPIFGMRYEFIIHCEPKKTPKCFFIYSLYKTWLIVIKFRIYILWWVNLSYGNVNVFRLTCVVCLPYLAKLSIRVLQVNSS